jgi:hypothetical protein
MHYRNGREAKNGDQVVQMEPNSAKIVAAGTLIEAKAGNDYCNGMVANSRGQSFVGACLCDCLHVDDVCSLLIGQGLDKRPAGK